MTKKLKSLQDLGVLQVEQGSSTPDGPKTRVFFHTHQQFRKGDPDTETEEIPGGPWLVHVPALGITAPLYGSDGEALTGFLNVEAAARATVRLIEHLVTNPNSLVETRNLTVKYPIGSGTPDDKVLNRDIELRPEIAGAINHWQETGEFPVQ